jgi:hypothetical protein
VQRAISEKMGSILQHTSTFALGFALAFYQGESNGASIWCVCMPVTMQAPPRVQGSSRGSMLARGASERMWFVGKWCLHGYGDGSKHTYITSIHLQVPHDPRHDSSQDGTYRIPSLSTCCLGHSS